MKHLAKPLTGILAGLTIAAGTGAPAFADSHRPVNTAGFSAQADAAVQQVNSMVRQEESAYSAVVGQVRAALRQTSQSGASTATGSTVTSSVYAGGGFGGTGTLGPSGQGLSTALQAALSALSQASSPQAALKALSQLEGVLERLKEALKTEQEHVLSGAARDRHLSEILREAQDSVRSSIGEYRSFRSRVVSDLQGLSAGRVSYETFKRDQKDLKRFEQAGQKLVSKLRKWEGKLTQELQNSGSSS